MSKSRPRVFLTTTQAAPCNLKICLPHLPLPISIRRFATEFPDFAATFDGMNEESTLLWYWKVNVAEGVLEFKSPDDEDEVAQHLHVAVPCVAAEDEAGGSGDGVVAATGPLTAEQRQEVKEHIADIRKGLECV